MAPAAGSSKQGSSSSRPVPSSLTSGAANLRSASAAQPNHSSLSSIVSHLVRSSFGTAADAVPDDELDRHVAQQLLNEAKAREREMGFASSSSGRTSWIDQPDKYVVPTGFSIGLASFLRDEKEDDSGQRQRQAELTGELAVSGLQPSRNRTNGF